MQPVGNMHNILGTFLAKIEQVAERILEII